MSDCSWFAEGVLIIFFALKNGGTLIGAGALKGANTVVDQSINQPMKGINCMINQSFCHGGGGFTETEMVYSFFLK